ncbi:probable ADP-ribosylation factor GTPase-activating protein AGD14 isoform X2 [Carica papaya]|uniref:probable ADP-ribosylation factor GTPase-activating protein AGD14 isoform X2 n=1 Tax=Carica papaya TaxID=3649 RepID=UPI000B8CBE0B|nr:probable ADP-ribosylation factor GTPase-activating protein AGD14 isoform X2 [Carica papaya]
MGSRKEEERNEKIIRGLMKLPPNRRCINCNSLGPQYVCTNFWTFICMTCSGIHREFTHRVKSVSMAKFTSQEVEALQNGGNQRAREMYLKDWDPQRQRLPDSSNADKVREFIKNVYVDKKYAGGKTSDKPPRSAQNHRSFEEETRRASSYHSYSQSPPYDYQYEERRYGKQAAVLSRTPGSDRGYYAAKLSSFAYSPNHSSDQMYEDRFANEGSVSRVSDYSVSSGGDPFRCGTESPSFQRDNGISSPPVEPAREILSSNGQHQTVDLFSEANFRRETDGTPHPQRTTSMENVRSFDGNSMSLKSYNSGSFGDAVSGPEQPVGTPQTRKPTSPRASPPVNYGGLDLFSSSVIPESNSTGVAAIDLFQLPATSAAPSADFFHPATISSSSSMNSYQSSQTYHPFSIDLFADTTEQQPPVKLPGFSIQNNEGWATFDTQPAAFQGTENITPAEVSSGGDSVMKFDPSKENANVQWPQFQHSSADNPRLSISIPGQESLSGVGDSSTKFDQVSMINANMQLARFQHSSPDKPVSSISSPGQKGLSSVQAPPVSITTQSWNAFDDSTANFSLGGIKQTGELPTASYDHSLTANQHLSFEGLEDFSNDGIQSTASFGGSCITADITMEASYTQPMVPPMGESKMHLNGYKSTNPFDLPYDSDLEQNNMFLDMSSLQAALPDAQLPSTFVGGVSQPWFHQNTVSSYIPAVPQGGLTYMGGQTSSSQLLNVPAQEHVASIGGNPFA